MNRSLATLSLALLAPLAAHAGEVLVPLAANQTIDGSNYSTRLWITNQGGTARFFTTRFIAAETNGTQAPESNKISVAPGATVVLTNIAPLGKPGMLRVTGAPQLAISARLEAVDPTGRALASTALPIVDGAALADSGGRIVLSGGSRRADGSRTDLYLLNAANAAASCTIDTFRGNGQRIGERATVSVLPLGLRAWEDAFGLYALTSVADARFVVSCNQPFFAHTRIFRPGTSEHDVAGPASIVDVVAPTAAEPLEGVAFPELDLEAEATNANQIEDLAPKVVEPDGTVTLAVPGEFLRAKAGDSFKAYNLGLPLDVPYKKAEIEYDLFLARWRTPLFHGVSALRRLSRRRQEAILYTGLILRGSSGFKTILDIGKDPRTGEGELIRSDRGPWKQNTQYHLKLTYDVEAKRVTFQVFKAGQLLQTVAGPINNLNLSATEGKAVRLDFGQTGIADGAYFPPFGWVYSNLTVRVTK